MFPGEFVERLSRTENSFHSSKSIDNYKFEVTKTDFKKAPDLSA